MIDHTRIFVTDCVHPHKNLAVEDAMLQNLPAGEAILFLWQNAHTVVIGAGQNAWSECDTGLLAREGGTLARRSSGGGAVYHDLGNLNFSFIVPKEDYDVTRQLGVVLDAVRALGIDAQATGRNDLTADDRKFSGNAFRLLKHSALHHGTLLCATDMVKGSRYLNVDPEKLRAKGVKSVRSRVVNLSELQNLTVSGLKDAMIDAFSRAYGASPIERVEDTDLPGLDALLPRYESWDWNYGHSPRGDAHFKTRFPWGGVEIYAALKDGRVERARVYTDSMDETLSQRLEAALAGCPFTGAELQKRAETACEGEIGAWLCTCV